MTPEDEGTRWDRPYWEDATQYPSSPDELSDWQWKWEFLKRLPEFLSLRRPARMWKHPSKRDTIYDRAFVSMGRAILDFGVSSNVLLGDSVLAESPLLSVAGTTCDFPSRTELVSEFEQAAQKGVENLLETAKWFIWDLYFNGIIQSGSEELASRYVAVRFDLAAPITPQLQKAKENIRDERERFGMNEIRAQLSATSRDKWIRHLRVLDAKEDGATHAEIFLRFADEGLVTETADSQPNAVVSQWITQANEVMEKVARFL